MTRGPSVTSVKVFLPGLAHTSLRSLSPGIFELARAVAIKPPAAAFVVLVS